MDKDIPAPHNRKVKIVIFRGYYETKNYKLCNRVKIVSRRGTEARRKKENLSESSSVYSVSLCDNLLSFVLRNV